MRRVWLIYYKALLIVLTTLQRFCEGGDELVPVDGKDEIYDAIMTEINELQEELAEQLKKFEKSLGLVSLSGVVRSVTNTVWQVFPYLLA